MGTQLPLPKGAQPPILADLCCGQTDGWIKMPLGMEVGLGAGHIVLDRDPAPLQERGIPPIFGPSLLWPNAWWIKLPLGMEVGLGPGDIVLDWGPSSPWKGAQPHFSADVYCGQTAG